MTEQTILDEEKQAENRMRNQWAYNILHDVFNRICSKNKCSTCPFFTSENECAMDVPLTQLRRWLGW